MLSTLLLILKYVALIAAIVVFLIFFIPLIVKWFTWALSIAYACIALVPSWVAGLFMICLVLALVSLGVKLL